MIFDLNQDFNLATQHGDQPHALQDLVPQGAIDFASGSSGYVPASEYLPQGAMSGQYHAGEMGGLGIIDLFMARKHTDKKVQHTRDRMQAQIDELKQQQAAQSASPAATVAAAVTGGVSPLVALGGALALVGTALALYRGWR